MSETPIQNPMLCKYDTLVTRYHYTNQCIMLCERMIKHAPVNIPEYNAFLTEELAKLNKVKPIIYAEMKRLITTTMKDAPGLVMSAVTKIESDAKSHIAHQ